jgi:hypothetical protein
MQINSLLASLIFTTSVSGHGFPISMSVAGKPYKVCTTQGDPATRNIGAVDWEFATDGPIVLGSAGMACNVDVGDQPGPTPKEYATANAGDVVSLDWGPNWPPGHVGPKDFYLARCQKDCTGEDVTQVSWFKIGEVGHDGGEWHDSERIDSVTLPTNIKAGFWILRGSRLALHTTGDPQLYPHCYRLKIFGDGSALPPGIKIPGGINPNDPGYTVNIYQQSLASYTDPGPAVYQSGQTGTGNTYNGQNGKGNTYYGQNGSGQNGKGNSYYGQNGTGNTYNGQNGKGNTYYGQNGSGQTGSGQTGTSYTDNTATGNKNTYNNDKTDSTHTNGNNDNNTLPKKTVPSYGNNDNTLPKKTVPSYVNNDNNTLPKKTVPSYGNNDNNTPPKNTVPPYGNNDNTLPKKTVPSYGNNDNHTLPKKTVPSYGNNDNSTPPKNTTPSYGNNDNNDKTDSTHTNGNNSNPDTYPHLDIKGTPQTDSTLQTDGTTPPKNTNETNNPDNPDDCDNGNNNTNGNSDSNGNNDSNPYNPYTSQPQGQKPKTYKRNARPYRSYRMG